PAIKMDDLSVRMLRKKSLPTTLNLLCIVTSAKPFKIIFINLLGQKNVHPLVASPCFELYPFPFKIRGFGHDGPLMYDLVNLYIKGPSWPDRKSTRLNSSHVKTSYAVFCWQKNRS